MKHSIISKKGCARRYVTRRFPLRALSLAALTMAGSAHAFEIETENPDLKMHWDNTAKYSAAARLKGQAPILTSDPNQDDGDKNFNRGLISNRLDLLSEFDATYKDFGIRVSGAAWYDTVYNQSNQNNSSPSTVNSFGTRNNQFSSATKSLSGQKVDLLDAFVSGKINLGDMPATFRLGRHALIWGESLFFGGNGIAAGQAPIDVSKALAVPNLKFNELIRPDNQLSGQLQIKPNISVGGYYKFSWEENRLPALGSYFSGIAPDFVLPGADMLFVPGAGTNVFFGREADMKAKNSGQGGVQLKYRPEGTEVDLGFYALQYNDRNFQVLLKPGVFTSAPLAPNQIGQYQLAYHENIKTYGVSASTSVGNVNVAGEISVHRNLDLQSTAQLDFTNSSNNSSNPLYAVGNSLQAQVSWIASLGPSFIAREASWIGEVAWNRRTSITKNAGALDPNSTRDAWSLRTVFEPAYKQALPGVDLSIPIGLGYTPKGSRSSVVGAFGVENGGDISVGLNGAYLDAWRFGLNYTHYYGRQNTFLVPISIANQTYAQSLKDRDFISFTASRTF
ncbi:Protein of unknown function [Collimonas sp. OK607]|uniref:DUF1302 domain-containing protein n=1 Tax=Collimonas sp. OK607 TaxID=1798194 RepID=UPI0008F44435|nr:DUF1302 domain-containing protein [Collimonas sp. OK607]SFB27676.1 Protein of unknown function [Collimonas sp. OK607]